MPRTGPRTAAGVLTVEPPANASTAGDAAAAAQGQTYLETWDLVRRRTIHFKVPGNASEGVLSPDLRWLAYASDETGTPQVYVQAFPGGGRPARVSGAGGRAPRWRDGGRALYFEAPDGGIMVARVAPGAAFRASVPRLLFHATEWSRTLLFDPGTPYDVSADGQRFILRQTAATTDAVLVQNWHAKLKGAGGQ